MSVSAKLAIVLALGFTLLVQLGCTGPAEKRATITVAAASSLTAAMEEVAALWNERSDVEVRCTFGATSSLVRQIERGAPYDVLLSANESWVEYLVASEYATHADAFHLGWNQLVIVAPEASKPPKDQLFSPSLGSGSIFGVGRWALGDPEHVPVGIYAKQGLEHLGEWDDIQDRFVPAASARAVLRLVERGEVDFGIVYFTDMLSSESVYVVAGIPGPRVELMGCPLTSAGDQTREFTAWLQGPEVRAVLSRHGFDVGDDSFPRRVR